MFTKASADGYLPAVPDIVRKTLVFGEKTLMSEFRLEAGAVLPRHAHPFEQTGYLVSGMLELIIGAETFLAGPGDSWCIPADVPHQGLARQACVALEVFAPLREDYLPRP